MDIRTLVFGLGVFCATFLVAWWLNIGAVIYGTGASYAPPVAAAAVPATQTSSVPRSQLVVHVPQTTSAQTKAPTAKSAQAKDLQDPQAKSAPRKSGIRIRRR